LPESRIEPNLADPVTEILPVNEIPWVAGKTKLIEPAASPVKIAEVDAANAILPINSSLPDAGVILTVCAM
jgi:hypothetical protein